MATTTPRRTGTRTSAARGSTAERDAQFAADTAAAKLQIDRAFALAGLSGNGPRSIICPGCGAVGKTKLNADGYAHCFKEAGSPGYRQRDAIEVLRLCGWTFNDAVDDLLDRPRRSAGKATTPASPPKPTVLVMPTVEDFTATVDIEVYNAVRDNADLDAAIRFYSRWHISPDAVERMGARVVTDPDALAARLVEQFGRERLVACGIAMPTEDDSATGAVRLLVNRSYPVIEPHLHPNGTDVLSMQFRASAKTEARIAAHKAYKAAVDAAEVAGTTYDGDKVPYVPKFLSLRGSPVEARVGFNLASVRAAALHPDRDPAEPLRVMIVEGAKDAAAAATWGRLAYAIPGVGVHPPARVLAEFGRLKVELAVSLDGDTAGSNATSGLVDTLQAAGLTAYPHPLPEGQDVTDTLVAAYAARGCPCDTCTAWRG